LNKQAAWVAFPYPSNSFHYAGGALKKRWDRLHLGDMEPYPGEQYLAKLCKSNAAVADSIPDFDGDFGALSKQVAEAWRRYHDGNFQAAAELGLRLGLVGYAAANKATVIYANYLEKSKRAKLKLFQEVAARAKEAATVMPRDLNSYYLHAYALGRYSQGTSVLEALAQGLGSRIKDSLEHTLELEPRHAEAHTAMGTYHAEIVDKVGTLLGGMTYGASKNAAVKHYEHALRLQPQSAIARIEFANGLLMLFGKSKLNEATQLYIEASKLEAHDAMEQLDIEMAKSQLEDES
jgi:hypothetical protein